MLRLNNAAFTIAFAIITALHIVLGELVPRRGQHRRLGALLLLCPGQPDHRDPFPGPGQYDTPNIQMFGTSE